MATKKQKRLDLQKRREEEDTARRESGLRAQQRDREIHQQKRERAAADAERINRRHQNILATARLRGEL